MVNPQTNQEERRKLAVEIYDLTGMKADLDDPFITAALFYSAKMRCSAEAIEAQIATIRQTTADSVAEIRKAHAEVIQSVPAIAAKAGASACQSEFERLKGNLSLFMDSLKRKVQSSVQYHSSEAHEEAMPKSVKTIAATMAIMTVLGVMFGARAFGQADLTPKQVQQMHFGRDVANAYEYMDEKTKKGFMAALEKSSAKHK